MEVVDAIVGECTLTSYRIEHATTYTYDKEVTGSYGTLHLRPRELAWQRVLAHEVQIQPQASDVFRHSDGYGNDQAYFHVTEPHTTLDIVAISVLEIEDPPRHEEAEAIGWELARPAANPEVPDAWQATDFTLLSPMIDQPAGVRDYALRSFTPNRPIGEAARDLMHRIYADFEYESGSTTVTTKVSDLLRDRHGVCQDFAHFMVAGLRSLGLAARYMSGYLATTPAPGKERLVGADASHAWVGCWIPHGGWLHLDPTNNRLADQSHATVAWGRDYGDVPPVKGVIFTQAKKSTMKVAVDMAPAIPPNR